MASCEKEKDKGSHRVGRFKRRLREEYKRAGLSTTDYRTSQTKKYGKRSTFWRFFLHELSSYQPSHRIARALFTVPARPRFSSCSGNVSSCSASLSFKRSRVYWSLFTMLQLKTHRPLVWGTCWVLRVFPVPRLLFMMQNLPPEKYRSALSHTWIQRSFVFLE